MKIETTMKITVGGTVLELTEDEARALWLQLNSKFESRRVEYVPYPGVAPFFQHQMPMVPLTPQWPPTTNPFWCIYDRITC